MMPRKETSIRPETAILAERERCIMELRENLSGLEHVGVPTADIEKTIAFYESIGFEVALRTAIPDGGSVAFLRLGDVMVETYESDEAAGRPGAIDHLALKARDIEAAFEAVKALGYELVNEQIEFLPFWDRGVRYFTFYGPNREKIEFSQML